MSMNRIIEGESERVRERERERERSRVIWHYMHNIVLCIDIYNIDIIHISQVGYSQLIIVATKIVFLNIYFIYLSRSLSIYLSIYLSLFLYTIQTNK